MSGGWLYGVLVLLLVWGCSKPSPGETEKSAAERPDSLTVVKKKKIRDFWAHYRQATKLRIAGSWQEAANEYSAALVLNAGHEDARYYLANMYLELNEWAGAEGNWYKLLDIDPSSSRANYQLGKLYLNPQAVGYFDLDKAAVKFQTTSDINQDFLQPILHLAQIAIIRGNYSAGREQLRIVLGSDYKNIEAWFLMGFIDYKEGQMQDARTNFNKAREFSVQKNQPSEVSGEGDTKTGRSLERAINQSIFTAYLEQLEPEAAMQSHYDSLNSFIVQLRAL